MYLCLLNSAKFHKLLKVKKDIYYIKSEDYLNDYSSLGFAKKNIPRLQKPFTL